MNKLPSFSIFKWTCQSTVQQHGIAAWKLNRVINDIEGTGGLWLTHPANLGY
jgi:hypothetical protein